jgi:hypothetical protein
MQYTKRVLCILVVLCIVLIAYCILYGESRSNFDDIPPIAPVVTAHFSSGIPESELLKQALAKISIAKIKYHLSH